MLQVSESEMRNIKNALAAALAWIDNAQLGGGVPSVKAEQVSGASAAPDKEMQMLIDLPGVSINATPRKDGLFQGYAVRDGIKKYLYGKTRAEVVQKVKRDYLQGRRCHSETETNKRRNCRPRRFCASISRSGRSCTKSRT